MAFLEASDLTKRYGRHSALSDVSIEIEHDESVVLLGPNGAGKSTLISLLASLTTPTAGEITIGGASLHGGDPTVRSAIGVCGHDSMLYDDLTARENLQLQAKLTGLKNPSISDTLEHVGLAHRGSDRVGQFSHGMTKRLALARALLADPSVLLLDEPFSGLDQASLQAVQSVLADQGRAILAATHNVSAGYELGDRFLFMSNGAIVGELDHSECPTVATLREKYRKQTGGGFDGS